MYLFYETEGEPSSNKNAGDTGMSEEKSNQSSISEQKYTEDLESLLFQGQGDRIALADLKEHIGGPVVSIALHAVILILMATIFATEAQVRQEQPKIVVQAQEAEVVKPPEDEMEELYEIPEQFETTEMIVTDLPPMRAALNRAPLTEAVAMTEDVATEAIPLDIELSALTTTDSNSALKMSGLTAFGRAAGGKRDGRSGMDAIARATMLQGVFYDLKQTPRKKPSEIGEKLIGQQDWFQKRGQMAQLYKMTYRILCDFVGSDWERVVNDGKISYPFFQEKFFSPRVRLMNSCLYIPTIPAQEAPKAFRCEDEVKPSTWVAIYGGSVVAPRTGKFRFVGSADDILAVRFNGERVFDYGYSIATLACGNNAAVKKAISKHDLSELDPEVAKRFRASPLFAEPLPIRHPQGAWGQGVCAGKTFSVERGKSYDIDILISEIPGGQFQCALFIEQTDPKIEYEKDRNGCPILPLFWTTKTIPTRDSRIGGLIPFDRSGPVWRVRTEKRKKQAKEDDISL